MYSLKNLDPSLSNQDLDKLFEIQKACFTPAWSLQQIQRQLEYKFSWNFGLYEREEMIGFVFYRYMFEQSELLQIAISPNKQHQGLGKRLLQGSLDAINDLQVGDVSIEAIFLEVRASNKSAIVLYESLGFVLDGVRKDYYSSLTQSKAKENAHLYSLKF